jgi:hypothetical protein
MHAIISLVCQLITYITHNLSISTRRSQKTLYDNHDIIQRLGGTGGRHRYTDRGDIYTSWRISAWHTTNVVHKNLCALNQHCYKEHRTGYNTRSRNENGPKYLNG